MGFSVLRLILLGLSLLGLMSSSAIGGERIELSGSVGAGGKNFAEDVGRIQQRLKDLGFSWIKVNRTVDRETIRTIKLFQSIKNGRQSVAGDGRVDRDGDTHQWLQAANAPRWTKMSASGLGFKNIELLEVNDDHDYGTDWLDETIKRVARVYQQNYRVNHSSSLLTVNDVSPRVGGNSPDHAGHETGLCVDLRLPQNGNSGAAPGGRTFMSSDYDRAATRAILQSFRADPLCLQDRIFFNDPQLIMEGLCTALAHHDNHIHVEIRPPARQIESSPDTRPIIQEGSRNAHVVHLQKYLNMTLVPSPRLEEDGAFGPNTKAALERFQTASGLPVTGVVDSVVWVVIDRPTIQLGDSGNAVTFLQESLNRIDGLSLPASGTFDAETRDAVVSVQNRVKLSPSGTVGSETWEIITSLPSHDLTDMDSVKTLTLAAHATTVEPGTREWTTREIALWKTPVLGNSQYVFEFKKQWVRGYRQTIIEAAKRFDIPAVLLAGVAFNEVGGDPLWFDDLAYRVRSIPPASWALEELGKEENPLKTSFGDVSIQIRRAAETLGLNPQMLTDEQELDLINLLRDSRISIFISAKHLLDLREIDFSGVPAREFEDDHIQVVGTRYNRGPDLTIQQIRQNLGYGRAITNRISALNAMLTAPKLDASELSGEALLIVFPDYPVNTDTLYGYTTQVGHAGVVLIQENGLTKYYDFGRYNPETTDGRALRRPIPNVEIENGKATHESLRLVLAHVSKLMQQQTTTQDPQPIRAAYFINMSFDRMNSYAKSFVAKSDHDNSMYDRSRQKYSVLSFNCGHFAERVILQGNPKVDRPLIINPVPKNIIDEYVEEGNAEVKYDPGVPNQIIVGQGDEADAKLP